MYKYESINIPANGKRSLCVASQPALAGDPGSAESLSCCLIAPGPGFVSAAQPFHIFRGAKVQPFFAERKSSSEVFLGRKRGRMFQVAWTREEFTHWPIRRLQSSQCVSVSVTVLCLKPRQEGPAREGLKNPSLSRRKCLFPFFFFLKKDKKRTTQFLSGS